MTCQPGNVLRFSLPPFQQGRMGRVSWKSSSCWKIREDEEGGNISRGMRHKERATDTQHKAQKVYP